MRKINKQKQQRVGACSSPISMVQIHIYTSIGTTLFTCILYTLMQVACIYDTVSISYIHATCISAYKIHVEYVFQYLCIYVSAYTCIMHTNIMLSSYIGILIVDGCHIYFFVWNVQLRFSSFFSFSSQHSRCQDQF
jgi:hypothetical protein